MTWRLSLSSALIVAVLPLSGCRSAFVETSIENSGPSNVHLIEVDYPSASFGTQTLDAHSTYHYRFKIQGSGPVTISFTDDAGKAHSVTGPTLEEGQQGQLTISIDSAYKVGWKESLTRYQARTKNGFL
jgi:hypothetical protein